MSTSAPSHFCPAHPCPICGGAEAFDLVAAEVRRRQENDHVNVIDMRGEPLTMETLQAAVETIRNAPNHMPIETFVSASLADEVKKGSEAMVEQLTAALLGGSVAKGPTPSEGAPLQVESLEATLKLVTFKEREHFWKASPYWHACDRCGDMTRAVLHFKPLWREWRSTPRHMRCDVRVREPRDLVERIQAAQSWRDSAPEVLGRRIVASSSRRAKKRRRRNAELRLSSNKA